jgi:Ran GTPase-activating protein (RanGAP) involved in mRNA processing and transport
MLNRYLIGTKLKFRSYLLILVFVFILGLTTACIQGRGSETPKITATDQGVDGEPVHPLGPNPKEFKEAETESTSSQPTGNVPPSDTTTLAQTKETNTPNINSENPICKLPSELLTKIVGYLPRQDIMGLFSTCKGLRNMLLEREMPQNKALTRGLVSLLNLRVNEYQVGKFRRSWHDGRFIPAPKERLCGLVRKAINIPLKEAVNLFPNVEKVCFSRVSLPKLCECLDYDPNNSQSKYMRLKSITISNMPKTKQDSPNQLPLVGIPPTIQKLKFFNNFEKSLCDIIPNLLQGLVNLEEFVFAGNDIKISFQDLEKLVKALQDKTKLKKLVLEDIVMGGDVRLLFELLERLRSLTNLSLQDVVLSADETKQLVEALKLKIDKGLQYLFLKRNKIGDEGVEQLADALGINKCWQVLNLEVNEIGPKGAEHLAQALKINGRLEEFSLAINDIGAVGAEQLADALTVNTSLKRLHLSWNNIGDIGAKQLAEALKINTSLERLDLSWNNIGNIGAKQLAEALKVNTSLRVLDLRYNKIDDEGAKQLAEALKINTSLKVHLY